MGKIRRLMGELGLAAAGLAAAENAAHAQTPGKQPVKQERVEKSFSPQVGFKKLLEDYATRGNKADLQNLKDLEQLERQRAAKNEGGSADIWIALADTYRTYYDVLYLVQQEITLLEAKQNAGSNALKLSTAVGDLDSADRRREFAKKYNIERELGTEERIRLNKLAGFGPAIRSFVKQEREYYGATNLLPLGDDVTYEDLKKMIR